MREGDGGERGRWRGERHTNNERKREKERERNKDGVMKTAIERWPACVCLCEREREREREISQQAGKHCE